MRRSVAKAVVAALASVGAGCSSGGPRTVYNPDPTEKIPAIVRAAQARNARVVPPLVKDLDSEDPAIRFYAIRGLRDITGEEFGYRYYDDEMRRGPALEKWKKWLANQPKSARGTGQNGTTNAP